MKELVVLCVKINGYYCLILEKILWISFELVLCKLVVLDR